MDAEYKNTTRIYVVHDILDSYTSHNQIAALASMAATTQRVHG
jgi:hypothetical protein